MITELLDYQAYAIEHPEVAELPDQQKLDGLVADCFVQLRCANQGEYWVRITDVNAGHYTGTVEDKNVQSDEVLHLGEKVEFETRHIADFGCGRYCWC